MRPLLLGATVRGASNAVGGYITVEGDPDSEAEDVAWVAFGDLFTTLSYPNERRLAALAIELLRNIYNDPHESHQSSHQNGFELPPLPEQ